MDNHSNILTRPPPPPVAKGGSQARLRRVSRFQIRNPKSEIRNRLSTGRDHRPISHGFTLVEMLVAVGLVVLMMVLFASIFQLATGTMTTQKGISENDQRVRLMVTMLRNDLGSTDNDPVTNTRIKARRTIRVLIPYSAGETGAPRTR